MRSRAAQLGLILINIARRAQLGHAHSSWQTNDHRGWRAELAARWPIAMERHGTSAISPADSPASSLNATSPERRCTTRLLSYPASCFSTLWYQLTAAVTLSVLTNRSRLAPAAAQHRKSVHWFPGSLHWHTSTPLVWDAARESRRQDSSAPCLGSLLGSEGAHEQTSGVLHPREPSGCAPPTGQADPGASSSSSPAARHAIFNTPRRAEAQAAADLL